MFSKINFNTFVLREENKVKLLESYFSNITFYSNFRPSTMKDFRHIYCYNVVYKCISKVHVAHLKPYLDDLVGPQQSAFVQGRHIADNILLVGRILTLEW